MHFNIFQLSHTLFIVYEPMKNDKKQITKIYEKAICAMHKIYKVSKTVKYSNILKLFELGHEEMCLMSYANNKGADQPAHPRGLISAFIVRCLDSTISLDSIAEISRLLLASVAQQASLSLTWSETPEDTFSHDEAHLYFQEI